MRCDPYCDPYCGPDGWIVTFQLWHWHADGERYGVEHFQSLSEPETAVFAARAGFAVIAWHEPDRTGFFQPVLTAGRY